MKKAISSKIALLIIVMLFVSLFSACNKFNQGSEKEQESDDSVVLTVGDIEVSLEEAMMYASILKYEYESMYGASIWELDFGGYTFEDMAKESIIEQITQIKISNIEAKSLGIELTDDEKAEAEEEAANNFEELEDSESKVTKELLQSMYMEDYLVGKVFEYVTKDVDTDISDEEAKQITVQHLLVMTGEYDENDELIPLSKEEQDAALKRAEEFLEEAKNIEDFEAFAEENTEDPTGVVEITFGKGEMDTAFEEVSFALKPGEMSELVKSQYGYHIIYCISDFDEDATAEAKEDLIAQKQEDAFFEIYDQWKEGYTVTINEELWATVRLASEDGSSDDNGLEFEIEDEE